MRTTKFLAVVLVGLYFLLFLFVYIALVLVKCGLQLVMLFVFSVFVVELVLCSYGPNINPELICCGPSTNLQQKLSKLLIDLTYCILFPWARSQGHNQPNRARPPHVIHTILLHTTLSTRSSTFTIGDYHPPRQPPRRDFRQLCHTLRAIRKFFVPTKNMSPYFCV